MPNLFSNLIDEASSAAYLLTNLLIGAVALMAFFQTRRVSLLLISVTSFVWAVITVAHWITRHFLADSPSYSLIFSITGAIDLVNLLVCTAALVWFIRNAADALPPCLPKQSS